MWCTVKNSLKPHSIPYILIFLGVKVFTGLVEYSKQSVFLKSVE